MQEGGGGRGSSQLDVMFLVMQLFKSVGRIPSCRALSTPQFDRKMYFVFVLVAPLEQPHRLAEAPAVDLESVGLLADGALPRRSRRLVAAPSKGGGHKRTPG